MPKPREEKGVAGARTQPAGARADDDDDLARAELRGAEREGRRVAQALHDGACQTLSGIALMARVLSRKLQDEQPARAREVTELGELVERAAGELRDIIRALRPAAEGTGSTPTPK